MILQHGGCVFKEVFLETIELDDMSSETLWLHSVLMKAQFCYECLAWKIFPYCFPDIPTS